jgi:hypothetical protein
MKTSDRSQDQVRRQYAETIVTRHVREMFGRHPTLAGFHLRRDLMVAELAAFSWPGHTASRDLHELVMHSLIELAELHPEAVQLMRGRTFARSLH